MRIQMILPAIAALGLAACTVNNPPAAPSYVAVPTAAPTVITTQPVPSPTVILR
jgi:uncharacterized lipoprotein YmbA